MTEHLLSTLGLALRAGAVAVGEEPVGAAARAKKARVIFTARDAAASSVRRAYSVSASGTPASFPAGFVSRHTPMMAAATTSRMTAQRAGFL